jgi:hypothetical protein
MSLDQGKGQGQGQGSGPDRLGRLGSGSVEVEAVGLGS